MDKFCPLLKKSCVEHRCQWWTNVQGRHPQNGEVVNEWACAVELLPMLLINTAQEVRHGAAATESMRNETVNVGAAIARSVASGVAQGVERAASMRPTLEGPQVPRLTERTQ